MDTLETAPPIALTPAQIAAERESWAIPLNNAVIDTWQNGAAGCTAIVAVGDGGNSWGRVLRYTLFDRSNHPCAAFARTVGTEEDAWALAQRQWRADVARRLAGRTQ